MTNAFERFRRRNGVLRMAAQEKVNTHFIFQGYPSIEIYNSNDESLKVQAAVVNKQEQESGYIYTQKGAELAIGSVWTAKNLHLMITEEITIIKDVNWHKYHCLLCNLKVDDLYGFFIGPEKSHINIALKKEVLLTSQQKPLLILPGQPLKFQDKIMIKNRAWIVDEYDSISTEGITYYSLMPTTMSKTIIDKHSEEDCFIEEYIEPTLEVVDVEEASSDGDIVYFNPMEEIIVDTEDGYFYTDASMVTIKKRTGKQVVFSIPFGVQELTIYVKKDGRPISARLRVKE